MLFLAFSALLLNFHSVLQNFPPHCTTAPLSLLNMFQNISNLPTQNDNFPLQSASIKFVLN